MSRKKIPNRKALTDALRELDGNMAAVARRFHCTRQHVRSLVIADPELETMVEELSESFKDEAENMLYKHIREGNVVACIFYLKTKGRDRGYSERIEFVPFAQQLIEVELGEPKNNHTEALDGDGATVALLEQ